MSMLLAIPGNALPPSSPEVLEAIFSFQNKNLEQNTFDIQTEHVLHGGIYSRTVRLPGNTWIVGALIKIPTLLIVRGNALVFAGDRWYKIDGYQVLAACAGRKQIFAAIEPTEITMIFPSAAETVGEAEAQFTDEAELLISRRKGANDLVTITGVRPCLEQ